MDWTNPVVGVMVGGVSYGMDEWDAKEGRTKAFQNASDISNAILVAGGFGLGMFMPKYAGIGKTIGTAAMPLLTKSVIKAVRGMVASTASKPAFAPHARVAYGPAPVMQTTVPQFEGQRTY